MKRTVRKKAILEGVGEGQPKEALKLGQEIVQIPQGPWQSLRSVRTALSPMLQPQTKLSVRAQEEEDVSHMGPRGVCSFAELRWMRDQWLPFNSAVLLPTASCLVEAEGPTTAGGRDAS